MALQSSVETVDLAERYAAAERLLPHRWKSLVAGGCVRPVFIEGTDRFWYRTGDSFVVVDPDAAERRPLFDHGRLAETLSGPEQLTEALGSLEVTAEAVRLARGDDLVELDLSSHATRVVGPAPRPGESRSPDGRWAAVVRDHNLVLRDLAGGDEKQLTTDGQPGFSYGTPPDVTAHRSLLDYLGLTPRPLVMWSPDSRRLVTHRVDQRGVETMHLVQSSPPDGGRPAHRPYRYAIVSDAELPTCELFVFDAAAGTCVQAQGEPLLTPWFTPLMGRHGWWDAGGERFFFLDADRFHTTGRLNILDAGTGEVRTLIEETDDARVYFGPSGIPAATRVLSSGEILWWSERSGWGHLYLYDAGGRLVRQLTSGEWVVRDVVGVDEADRIAIVAGAGREAGLDPYVRQLYRLDLDTGELARITHDELDHEAAGSPSGRFVVDVASDVATPAVSVVRDATGRVVVELEAADASELLEAGYEPPERFVVKAADGVTDLRGVLYKPHDLDPSRRYPVLDDIYPGPAHAPMPVRFPGAGGTEGAHGAAFAALGFAVVVLNNRGTPLWSKAFRWHTRGAGYDDGIADHVTALRQLAQTRPWMDLDRVGIYGTSGGGHASTRAMLLHPDVFTAAVSAAGSHDEAVYHASWGEQFIGDPASVDYLARSNAPLAGRLEGKLLLIHGELDDNVTPHLTMRLVDAFMQADKDVDLMIIPNADHRLVVYQENWWRRRWDFFVRHLSGAEPPRYQLAPVPIDVEALTQVLMG